jgi:ribosome-associated protein
VPDSKPSKSARKREQLVLQKLGELLIELSEPELASLSLDDSLREAIRAARTMKSHGALRRQKQLIGKLMRDVDPEPIRARLAVLRGDDVRSKRIFALAEQWRDRIIRDGAAALEEIETETGVRDDELRALLARFAFAASEKTEKTVRREIFRRVRDILAEKGSEKGSDPI